MAERTFLGVGWNFPVSSSAEPGDVERIKTAAFEIAVDESIRLILATARGERMMRPDFGCDLNRLTFAPNNVATSGLATLYVREALVTWEPRIELITVDANADPTDASRLLISIEYRIVATNTVKNLVFPFYLGRE